MSVLVLAEVGPDGLDLVTTARVVAGAGALGPVTVLCYGANAAAQAAASIAGVANVLVAEAPAFAHALAEPVAALVASLATTFSHVVSGATAQGKNVMPRVAALRDAMIVSDVTKIISADTFERPIYAGNAIQTVQSSDPIKVLTIRATSFAAAGTQAAAPIETVVVPELPMPTEWVEDSVAASDRPELTSATVVVSGGRALGSRENFALIEQLAGKLNAAVGASRAAVDAGYAANDLQVGQTGKVVAPALYVAVGISGAIQHLAGMKDSKVIVAINSDAGAPIFQVADYGLVGDLFTIVPELIAKL